MIGRFLDGPKRGSGKVTTIERTSVSSVYHVLVLLLRLIIILNIVYLAPW